MSNNNNSYLNIDPFNYFKNSTEEEEDIINNKTSLFQDINKKEEKKYFYLKIVVVKFINIFFPNEVNIDDYSLSLNISKHFCKSKNLVKSSIEKYINFFFEKRVELTYSKSFILNIEVLKNLGNILSYAFSKMELYKVKNKNDIKNILNSLTQQESNVLTDFYNYVAEKGLLPNEENKALYWHQNKNKYKLPPELLFIINLFSNITIFDFDINFQDDSFDEEEMKYLFLILMNIDLFLFNLKRIKLNFIHEKFQKINNSFFLKRLILKDSNSDSLKINIVKNKESLYLEKWNFERNFMLEKFRNIELKKRKKEKRKIKTFEYDEFTIFQEKQKCFFNGSFMQQKDEDNDGEILNKTFEINDDNFNSINNLIPNKLNKNYHINNSMNLKTRKNNEFRFLDIVEKFHYTFDIIFLFLYYACHFPTRHINLIMNDSYNIEITNHLKKLINCDINNEITNFHILDIYTEPLNKVKSFNVEINSLDLITFDKILNLIFNNRLIQELKFSFFTSDINYYPYILYRTFLYFTKKKKIEEDSKYSENKVLEYLFTFFKDNLLYLFYLIKEKNFKILGLNFDIPIVIQKMENYMNVILKFLINVLIFINSINCKCNELTLLSPSTIMDGNVYNNIDKIFEEMNSNKNGLKLTELNLQFTIYKIPNIKNIIGHNLLSLSIGDLDLSTLEAITNHFNSYKFAIYSLLRRINIKLLENIRYINSKLKIILTSLFNIKLKNLKKLNLFTNIIIKNKKECSFLIRILKNNWIYSYTLILNKESQEYFKSFVENNNITFLVPHNLENELIGPEKNNNKNISTNTDDIVYWYLQYMFNNRYYYRTRNFKAKKDCIYNILKYLYFVKKIKLCYDIKNYNDKD